MHLFDVHSYIILLYVHSALLYILAHEQCENTDVNLIAYGFATLSSPAPSRVFKQSMALMEFLQYSALDTPRRLKQRPMSYYPLICFINFLPI